MFDDVFVNNHIDFMKVSANTEMLSYTNTKLDRTASIQQ